jgi:fucose permease
VVNSSASFTYNFLNTIVNTLTVWVDQANFRTWLNFVNTLFGVGSMLTPLLATAAHAFLGSFLAAYWVVAACSTVCAVFCFLVVAPPPPASYTEPPREAKRPGSAGPRPSSAASYWCMLLSVVGLVGLVVGSEVSFGAWIFTYSHKFASLDVNTSEAINSTYWAAFTAARVVAVSARRGSTWGAPCEGGAPSKVHVDARGWPHTAVRVLTTPLPAHVMLADLLCACPEGKE